MFAPARRVVELGARTVLDAGSGSGHLARFLASNGIEVVGFDIDPEMLEAARLRAPEITWLRADIASINLGRRFDAVLVAGNTLNFVAPERIPIAVARMAAHVETGGWLCAAFSRQGRFTVDDYMRWVAGTGLISQSVASDWSGSPLTDESSEVVAIHRRSSVEKQPDRSVSEPALPPRA